MSSYKLNKSHDEIKRAIENDVKLQKSFRVEMAKLHDAEINIPITMDRLANQISEILQDEPSATFRDLTRQLLAVLSDGAPEQTTNRIFLNEANKKCERALGNIEISSNITQQLIDRNKKEWTKTEEARHKASTPDGQFNFTKANESYNASTMDLVQKLREGYEGDRIKDWRLILGNKLFAEMKVAAYDLSQLEKITRNFATTFDTNEEANAQFSTFFKVGNPN